MRLSFPTIEWLRDYQREQLPDDMTAGFITAILLIPQGMAYATLAGLPPQVGLYAGILPPIVYALLGTSRTLSIGPVSVAALLVANALASSGTGADARYLQDALLLAAMSGAILLVMALLRMDVLINFINHPTLSGFTSAAAVLIILSQLSSLTGISASNSGSGLDILLELISNFGSVDLATTMLALAALSILLLVRAPLVRLIQHLGAPASSARSISRAGPLFMIAILTAIVTVFNLEQFGVAIVGAVPSGLPAASWNFWDTERALQLLPSALMIGVIGYVESISVAKILAYRRRERIDNNRELLALGAANIAASFSSGMPVAGGFSRSTVNFSAGARTPLATIVSAVLVAITAVFFTPLFYHLPKAALAAIIVVAVSSLFDWRTFVKTWHYDPADAIALVVTFLGVLLVDIEVGLLLGIIAGVGALLWRSSRPHIAIVGRLPGTQIFRNLARHEVETWPELLLLRVDRSLFFANISYVEKAVAKAAVEQPSLKHLVIICSAVNAIDQSAVDALEQMAENFKAAGINLHLAEVKGPVMDRLRRSNLPQALAPGQIFFSTQAAVDSLHLSDDQTF